MAGLLRILGVVAASIAASAAVHAIVNRTSGNSDMAAALGAILGLLVTPAVLLRYWKPPDPGRRCPEGHGLYPECMIVVTTADDAIEVKRQDGAIERIAFADLGEVRIDTSGVGPWAADVHWVLLDKSGAVVCTFPSGATGEPQAMARLQSLPGFNNVVFTVAMGSTGVAQFSCWKAGA